MSLSFRDLAPALADRLDGITRVPFIRYVNETVWIFAIVETAHLLFLAILGGAVLVLNLRLLGLALGDVPAWAVERATRPWLVAGIVGTIATGIAMGLTTANTLLSSGAFLVKMVALVAAILFSLAVAHAVQRGDSGERGRGRALALIALLWWIAALALFVTGRGLGAGAVLVALTGFVLFAAFAGRWRRLYLAGLAVILGGGLLVVELVSGDGVTGPAWLPLLPLGGALALAATVATLARRETVEASPARLTAFACTLAWITVAAAGRWIGFS